MRAVRRGCRGALVRSVQRLEPDHRGKDCGEDGVVAVVVAVAVLVAAVVAVFVAALEALAEVVVVLVLRNVIAVVAVVGVLVGVAVAVVVAPVVLAVGAAGVQAFLVAVVDGLADQVGAVARSEEHTSELQSLMRIPYA